MNTFIDEKSIDNKTRIEPKDKMKERVGHSPDLLDTMIMRMYLYLIGEQDDTTAWTSYLETITR